LRGRRHHALVLVETARPVYPIPFEQIVEGEEKRQVMLALCPPASMGMKIEMVEQPDRQPIHQRYRWRKRKRARPAHCGGLVGSGMIPPKENAARIAVAPASAIDPRSRVFPLVRRAG
jgi:hypothetical protein